MWDLTGCGWVHESWNTWNIKQSLPFFYFMQKTRCSDALPSRTNSHLHRQQHPGHVSPHSTTTVLLTVWLNSIHHADPSWGAQSRSETFLSVLAITSPTLKKPQVSFLIAIFWLGTYLAERGGRYYLAREAVGRRGFSRKNLYPFLINRQVLINNHHKHRHYHRPPILPDARSFRPPRHSHHPRLQRRKGTYTRVATSVTQIQNGNFICGKR